MPVPHILKDGADSSRRESATITRLRQYRDVLGILAYAPQSPDRTRAATTVRSRLRSKRIPSSGALRRSALGTIAAFFRRLQPFHLKDAPGGSDHITKDDAIMTRGKIVFAEGCAGCHSEQTTAAEHRSAVR